MIRSLEGKTFRGPLTVVGGAAALLTMTWPLMVWGQVKPDEQPKPADHAKHAHPDSPTTPPDDPLAEQVRQLREKIAKLEAALSQGQGGGLSSPMGRRQGMGMGTRAEGRGVGQGVLVSAQYQDCLRCHQTRPPGPLPPSHMEKTADMDMGKKGGGQAAAGQGEPAPDMSMGKMDGEMRPGVMGQGGQGMSGRQGMGGGTGMGMMGGAGGGMGMGMMSGEGMMGMGATGKGKPMGMGMMGGGGGGMGMMGDDGMMGMGAMGKAKRMGMGDMSIATHMPGFPGISHLYHIGAEGFFLNHDEHISLSANQRKKLNQLKQKALLGGSSCQRKVEEAEQELWELTASDAPDAAAIEAKVREIGKLQGDQRLAFIRAVGEAAKVLTDDQRQTLAGTATEASPKPATANP